MAERARRIDEKAADAMLRTFHSFGAWFLRRNGDLAGLDPGFVIYDDGDMVSLLSTIMKGAPKADVRQAAHKISRAKDYFFSPTDPGLVAIDGTGNFRSLYSEYEERLARIGNVDFGDLIKKPVEILRKEPEVARRMRDRFSVIMVDEYQDANIAQFELLKELAGPNTYVCVVGDDDQSIYRFRGAEVRNILEFPDRFPGAEIIRLESNYRSTSPILRAASSVVDYNKGRLGKTLRAERGGGKEPVLAFLPNQDEEVSFCAALIENSVKQNSAQWSDWAVLYRTNAQSLGFETEFLHKGIPYRVVGSLKFYEREEIKDALALLSFLVNPRDEVAFRRIVNKPARGLGAVTVELLVEAAMEQAGGGLLESARNTAQKLKPKARKGLEAFIKVLDDGRSLLETGEKNGATGKKKTPARKEGELVPGEGLSLCVTQMIIASGLAEYHLTQDEISGTQRLNNMQELVNAASLYDGTTEGLLEFLEHIELDRSLEENTPQDAGDSLAAENKVTLITFHNTKGLEFRRGIMTGLEHGIFPREDKKGEELEEERRLFYVGATRAMDELYLSSCASRRMFGRTMPVEPSVFLHEIDKTCLRIIGNAPYSFASRSHAQQKSGVFADDTEQRRDSAHTETELEKASGWRCGQKLFHDDHGYGHVVEVRASDDPDDGPIVRVKFENGKEVRFLSEYQGAAFEKIGSDV